MFNELVARIGWTIVLDFGGRLIWFNIKYPGFSASLIFELWEKEDGQIYVQVLYNGTAMKICSKNQTKCPYNEFQDILSQ